jgi:DNA-binding LacI/PurR family transcriptional regulator
MRSKNPSIVEVAAKAGVSIQTVSNVLNFPDRVKPKTRDQVLQVLRALDYTPNLSARRLRSNKSSSIAVRVDANSSPNDDPQGLYAGFIQDDFVYQLVEAADQREIKVIAYSAKTQESELEKLKRFIKSRDVDGIILSSTIRNDERIQLLAAMKVPFLSFGRPWGSPHLYSTARPWIDIDGYWGTASATRMFWELGLRKIGYIGWKSETFGGAEAQSVADDRYLGWMRTMMELDNTLRSSQIRKMASFGKESVGSGRESARKLLNQIPDLEAVVCVSDTMALGSLLELHELERESISICGFDNSPVSIEFGFSSLDQSLELVAQSALNVLMGETGNQVRAIDSPLETTQACLLLKPVLKRRQLRAI